MSDDDDLAALEIAIARRQRGQFAQRAAPRFRGKRVLRWAFDRLQCDWPFDLLIGSPPLREP